MAGMKELVEYGVIGLLIGLSLWAVAMAVASSGWRRMSRSIRRSLSGESI